MYTYRFQYHIIMEFTITFYRYTLLLDINNNSALQCVKRKFSSIAFYVLEVRLSSPVPQNLAVYKPLLSDRRHSTNIYFLS